MEAVVKPLLKVVGIAVGGTLTIIAMGIMFISIIDGLDLGVRDGIGAIIVVIFIGMCVQLCPCSCSRRKRRDD